MRVVSINTHPLIQLISKNSEISSTLKSKAIQDIRRMLTDQKYLNKATWLGSDKQYHINWAESDLGHDRWKRIFHLIHNKTGDNGEIYKEMYKDNLYVKIILGL